MENDITIILGAGPAGLAAGYELSKKGRHVCILEKDSQVGGIAKTMRYKDYYFDIGGHRFFTKEEEVLRVWRQALGNDFLVRPRLSRIYYDNKFYFYPLKPLNALKNIGISRALGIMMSYAFTRLKYYLGLRKKPITFEDWVTQRFGKKLFNIFFKTYTEKVWGIPTSEIGAEWASQRIRGLSLTRAVVNAFFPSKVKETSLIEQFHYPRLGPGMMYGKIAEEIKKLGGEIILGANVAEIVRNGNIVEKIIYKDAHGKKFEIRGKNYISSIPLPELVRKIQPPAPNEILEALPYLRFRAFFTVCLIINRAELFPDNWIYIHSPEVKVGRIQNFKNWSPDMVPDQNKTSLGMEYFCFENDEMWNMRDEDLIRLASNELEKIGLGHASEVVDGFVARVRDTYPIYKIGYSNPLARVCEYVKTFGNLQVIGRGGIFRYNNMDHSILSGIYAARNILGEKHDVYNINIEETYHETRKE